MVREAPFLKEFSEQFKNWVPRMGSEPVALEQEFKLDFAFEIHSVFMFRLENRKYAVVDVCCEEIDEYDPQWDTIILFSTYGDAYRAFRKFVKKELAEHNPI